MPQENFGEGINILNTAVLRAIVGSDICNHFFNVFFLAEVKCVHYSRIDKVVFGDVLHKNLMQGVVESMFYKVFDIGWILCA